MSIEAQLDEAIKGMATLVTSIGDLKAIIAAQGGATAPAAAEKAPARGKAATKTETVAGPVHTMDEVKNKFDDLKAKKQPDGSPTVPALKKLIADVGFASLAELLVKPEKFDEAFDKLTAFEATLSAPVEPEDDL